MIGQKALIEEIDRFVKWSNNRFIIVLGVKGSGKKLVSKYIAKKLESQLVVNDIKASAVRGCIETSYHQPDLITYVFYDAHKMSKQAKNSLLKITEEPPKKSYFILTVCNRWSVPDTLYSRATVFSLYDYTEEEIIEYANTVKQFNKKELEIIKEICTVPEDVNMLAENDINAFYEFINLVFENLAEVSGANAFKITQKIKTKEEGKGYDAYLFLKVLRNMYIKIPEIKYYEAWKITSTALNDLSVTGINKQFLIERWILDVRDCFLGD